MELKSVLVSAEALSTINSDKRESTSHSQDQNAGTLRLQIWTPHEENDKTTKAETSFSKYFQN